MHSGDAGAGTGTRGHPVRAGTLNSSGEGREGAAFSGGREAKVVTGGATTTFEERTTWDISAVSDAYIGILLRLILR